MNIEDIKEKTEELRCFVGLRYCFLYELLTDTVDLCYGLDNCVKCKCGRFTKNYMTVKDWFK